jgi:DnaK suppressor protein
MMSSELSPQDLAAMAELLHVRRLGVAERLKGQLAGQSRAEHARELLLQDGDDATQRDADREVDLAQSDKGTLELQAIDEALERLAQGRYGDCADCEEPIPLPRLRLEPQALYCIDCAARRERSLPKPPSM